MGYYSIGQDNLSTWVIAIYEVRFSDEHQKTLRVVMENNVVVAQ